MKKDVDSEVEKAKKTCEKIELAGTQLNDSLVKLNGYLDSEIYDVGGQRC